MKAKIMSKKIRVFFWLRPPLASQPTRKSRGLFLPILKQIWHASFLIAMCLALLWDRHNGYQTEFGWLVWIYLCWQHVLYKLRKVDDR